MTAPTLEREVTRADADAIVSTLREAAWRAVVAFQPLADVCVTPMQQLAERRATRDARLLAALATLDEKTLTEGVSVNDAVTNGVAFLDERYGRDDWLQRVDLERLDVKTQFDCVLAQVTGLPYTEALGVVGVPGGGSFNRTRWTDAHGFSRDLSDEHLGPYARYGERTHAWVSKISELRAEATS